MLHEGEPLKMIVLGGKICDVMVSAATKLAPQVSLAGDERGVIRMADPFNGRTERPVFVGMTSKCPPRLTKTSTENVKYFSGAVH
jgi:hypothetical protein